MAMKMLLFLSAWRLVVSLGADDALAIYDRVNSMAADVHFTDECGSSTIFEWTWHADYPHLCIARPSHELFGTSVLAGATLGIVQPPFPDVLKVNWLDKSLFMALQDECKIQGYLTVKSTLNTMKAHGYGIKPGSVERKGGGMDIGTLTFEAEKLDQRLYGMFLPFGQNPRPAWWSPPL